MTTINGCFPVSASKIGLAHEVCDNTDTKVIGVTIQILVLTEFVKELPDPWKDLAEAQLYRNAVLSNDT